MQGKKFGSKLLFLLEEKQIYAFKTKTASKTYYTCYIKDCPARMEFIPSENVCVVPKKVQNHIHSENQEIQFRNLKIMQSLKSDVVKSAGAVGCPNALSCVRSAYKRSAIR